MKLTEVTTVNKKIIFVAGVCICSSLSLIACKSEKKTSNLQVEVVSEEVQKIEEESVALNQQVRTLENDEVKVQDTEDLKVLLQISMAVPSYATQLEFAMLNHTIGEIKFSYDGISYSYRASTSCEGADLDQVTEEFTDSYYNMDLNGIDFSIYTTVNQNRLVSWNVDDVNYSLYVMGKIENSLLESIMVDLVFGEDAFGDASYVAGQMLPLFHGLNGYFYHTGNPYEPEDEVGYWISLTYVIQSAKDDLGRRYQIVEDEIKVKSSVLNKLVASLYPDTGDVSEHLIPAGAKDYVRYAIKEDAYYFKIGELGAISSVVTLAMENKDGLLIVESKLIDDETSTILAAYHYTLQLNTNDDGFSLYPYTMGTVLPVQPMLYEEGEE